jgi:hypothetical protein
MVGTKIIGRREMGVGTTNRAFMFWQGIAPVWRSSLYFPQPKVLEDLFYDIFTLITFIFPSHFG